MQFAPRLLRGILLEKETSYNFLSYFETMQGNVEKPLTQPFL